MNTYQAVHRWKHPYTPFSLATITQTSLLENINDKIPHRKRTWTTGGLFPFDVGSAIVPRESFVLKRGGIFRPFVPAPPEH